jgi:hypothetical protein
LAKDQRLDFALTNCRRTNAELTNFGWFTFFFFSFTSRDQELRPASIAEKSREELAPTRGEFSAPPPARRTAGRGQVLAISPQAQRYSIRSG